MEDNCNWNPKEPFEMCNFSINPHVRLWVGWSV